VFFIIVYIANRPIAELTQADGSVRVISTFTLLVTWLIVMNTGLFAIYLLTAVINWYMRLSEKSVLKSKGNKKGLQE